MASESGPDDVRERRSWSSRGHAPTGSHPRCARSRSGFPGHARTKLGARPRTAQTGDATYGDIVSSALELGNARDSPTERSASGSPPFARGDWHPKSAHLEHLSVGVRFASSGTTGRSIPPRSKASRRATTHGVRSRSDGGRSGGQRARHPRRTLASTSASIRRAWRANVVLRPQPDRHSGRAWGDMNTHVTGDQKYPASLRIRHAASVTNWTAEVQRSSC